MGQVEAAITQNGLAEALECAGAGIVLTDTEGKIQYANPAFLRMTGFAREDIVGQSTSLLRSGQQPNGFYDDLWRAIRQGKSWHGEMMNRHKDGLFYPEELQVDPIRDEANAVKGFIATKIDATKRQEAESAEALLTAIVDSSEDAICSLKLDGTVATWNLGAEALLGYSSDEAIGRGIALIAAPHRGPKVEEHLGVVRKGGRISPYDTVLCGKGNVEVAASFSIFPIRDGHGEIAGASVIARGIASRILAENKLRESDEMFRKVFAQAPYGICVIGVDGKYLLVNPKFCTMVGYSEKELLTMSWEELTLPQDIPSSRKMLQRLLASPAKVLSLKKRYQHRDGSKIWVRLKFSLLSDSAGKPIHAIVHVEDITEKMRLEQEKWEMQAEAQATIDALSSSICVLDDTGAILSVNESWRHFAAENRREDGATWAPVSFKVGLGEGENYLASCERAAGRGDLEAVEFAEGIRSVMAGNCDHYAQEYSCDEPFNSRSFLGSVTRFYVNKLPRVVVEHINITERKLAEDAMLEAKLIAEAETRKLDFQYSLIRAIHRVSLDGILVVDANHKIVSYNDRFLELWKLPILEVADPLQHDTILEIPDDLVLTAALENVKDAEAFATRVKELYDAPEQKDHCEIELKDGRTLERYSSALRGEDERYLGRVWCFRDITARKLANDALRESEQRYRATFEQAAIGIVHTSPDGKFLRCNARFAAIIGYQPDEVAGLSYLQVTAPEDQAESAKLFWELINGQKAIPSFEMRYVCKDGSITWVKSTISFLKDSDGNPLYCVTLVEDINARKLAESLLRETSERLMLATRAGGVGIWDLDLLADRMVWDEQMFRLFGFESGRLLDARQIWMEGLHPDDARQVNEGIDAAERGEGEFDTEFRIVWPDGSIHNIRAIAFVQRDECGKALHLIGTNWDITPQKRSAEELLQSNRMLQEETARASALAEEAAAATAAKSDFLANMSHEIRTPMNGVIGMTGLLLDTELSAEQRRYAETVRASGESLLLLINDILDFSKIEAQKLELETVDFDLPKLLGSIAGSIAAQAHAKNLELIASADPQVPTWVCGDPGRVRQIVTNLLGNALKFTSKGEVVLRAVVTEEAESDWLLRFSVRDTGIGIPANKLSGIFEKFTQVDSSTTRKFGGTGLGLAISQHLAKLMGGDIGVNSEEGKGSEFWFTVRLGFSAKREEPSPAESLDALRGLQVLIVDDSASNRQVLARQLTHWGMRTEEADSGIAALQAIYEAKDRGNGFQLALIDMQMAGMDGEAVGRAVRSDERLHDTHIVMLTSLGVKHGEQRCRQIGFEYSVSKPVQREELRSVLLAAYGATPVPGTDSTPETIVLRNASDDVDRKQTLSAGMGNARILIAEDNFTNQQVALGILKKLGLRADAVADGAEALKSLQRVPYDLVLMDMRMPVMDGVEATLRIRDPQSSVLNRAVPIIAMTANVLQSDRDRCLNAGMNGFVPKPVMLDALQQMLEKWLPTQDVRQSSDGLKGETILPADTEAKAFDQSGVLQRMMGDEDLMKLILKTFLDDVPGQIQKLKEYLQAGDAKASGRQAHSIRGAAANVGGERLRHTATKMEKSADAGELDSARACLEELESRFQELKDEIKQQCGVC